MRRLFEQTRQQLEAFIEQRDDLLLLVGCGPDDAGFVLQALRDAEQANLSDVFLLFSDSFVETKAFVSVAVERLKDEHRTACLALAEQGREPLPPPPARLSDPHRPPDTRLAEAIAYARSLLPAGGGHRLVWGMFPQEVADWPAYLRLVSTLVPWEGMAPWMRGTRLLFRSTPEAERHAPRLLKGPRARTMAVQLGPKEMEQGLHDDVQDANAPLEQRMQALVSLAVMDYGYNRLEDAEAKYHHLLGHYQATKDPLMQGFVLNGLGDVAKRRGDRDKAQEYYECAVVPTVEAKDAIVLSTVVRNLGDLAYERQRFAEAEAHYTQLDRLTSASLDAETKARALEWRGLSQEQQQALDRAEESWRLAAAFCREVGLRAPLRVNLEHLARVSKQQGKKDKLAEVQAELQALPREQRDR
jgi:tetratricopeptide (TPR) repeat protein